MINQSDTHLQPEDFTIDELTGYMILTKSYLKKRGYCCGFKCLNCPYIPKHTKGSKNYNEQ